MIPCDIKLECRLDEATGIVHARIPNPDNPDEGIEVSTLNAVVCEITPGLLKLWQTCMCEAIRLIVEARGAKIAYVAEHRLGDLN